MPIMPSPSFRLAAWTETWDTKILLLLSLLLYIFIVLVKKVFIYFIVDEIRSIFRRRNHEKKFVLCRYSFCVGIARVGDGTCTTTTCDSVNRQVEIYVGNDNIILCKLSITTNNWTRSMTYISFVKIRS